MVSKRELVARRHLLKRALQMEIFYFTDVRRARGAEPIKGGSGKKKSIFALGYNRGFKCDIYKGFYCLKRPFTASL